MICGAFRILIKVFEKMHDKTQGNIVIISHQERILDIADKIVVIADGEIQDIGAKVGDSAKTVKRQS